jgi:hypothetical protein
MRLRVMVTLDNDVCDLMQLTIERLQRYGSFLEGGAWAEFDDDFRPIIENMKLMICKVEERKYWS